MIGSVQGLLPRCARPLVLGAVAACWTSPAIPRAVWPDRLPERGTTLPRPIVPSQFRGHWSEDLSDCGSDPLDNSQLWITAGSVNFYETNGRVMRVTVENRRRAVVLLRSEGEGTVFTSRNGLALSPDGKTLTVRDEDDTGSSRFHRCPAATAPR